jgi:hypothetical protein
MLYAKHIGTRSLNARAFLVAIAALALVACDDSGNRQALAQCMLSPEAKDPHGFGEGAWKADYLRLCMQAKGYVLDENLPGRTDLQCGALAYPYVNAGCYRLGFRMPARREQSTRARADGRPVRVSDAGAA